jgi:hypothetical protein
VGFRHHEVEDFVLIEINGGHEDSRPLQNREILDLFERIDRPGTDSQGFSIGQQQFFTGKKPRRLRAWLLAMKIDFPLMRSPKEIDCPIAVPIGEDRREIGVAVSRSRMIDRHAVDRRFSQRFQTWRSKSSFDGEKRVGSDHDR